MTFRIAPYIEGPNPLYWFELDGLVSQDNTLLNPDASYEDFSEVVDTLGGGRFGRGFPVAHWHWDVLPAFARFNLRAICPGPSARVYIETPTNEVDPETNEPIWITASAVMKWPTGEEDRDANGTTADFNIDFTEIVEV